MAQRQDQDESHTQGYSKACPRESRIWIREEKPYAYCSKLAKPYLGIVRKSNLPDMGGYNLAMLWIRIGQDVLDQVVAVLIAGNCSSSQ